MKIKFPKSALAIIAGVLAVAIKPAPAVTPSDWASKNMIVADGPHAGENFDLDLTPYFREPLDFFADICPDNKASFRKSKQIGATTLAIAATGYTMAIEPCDLFLIEPTESNLGDFLALKLQPVIDQSPALRKAVAAPTTRSAKGSTTWIKKFRGGTLLTGIATSTADLRGKTRKKVIKDEASEYPEDLNGQGSPHEMIAGSYETFLQQGDWKELSISTPVIKGACYIDAEFEAGDQRRWHVKCPGCANEFYFCFVDADGNIAKQFRFNDQYPYEAHYVAPCCGTVIEHHQKAALVRAGRWIATAPGPGKHRSYHFDALSSPFVPWDMIAQRWIEAKDNPAKLKTFYNLTLGLAYEVKGDAPDHKRLMDRREDYVRGIIPAEGLLLTAAADVQHNGIWFEVVAWAQDGQSWSIDHGFLEGETTDATGGAFKLLREVYDRQFPDAFGSTRVIDALAVDAGDGGRSNQVYLFCRDLHRAFAIKGQPGWTTPAIGTPTIVSITLNGKKLKGGATLWPIGTWSLKSTFYANLRKDGRKDGAETDPPGYCHHHMECDEAYFRQQTAAFLKTAMFRGRSTRIWQETGPDHLLDCRVYNMAMVDYLGANRMTQDQWQHLRKLRGVPMVLKQPDLAAPEAVQIAARPPLLQPRKAPGRRVLSRGI